MKAMILAAGRGERLRPLTDHCPKPLLRVGRETLIGWHLRRLKAAGFNDIIINHAWLGGQIEHSLGNGTTYGVNIHYSRENPPGLETAGGIANALPLLGDAPFLVVNGDILSDFDFQQARRTAAALPLQQDAFLWLTDNPPHHPHGDFTLQADGLIAPPLPGRLCLTFSGIGIYRPRLFAGVSRATRAALAPLLYQAIEAGRVGGGILNSLWLDVGTADRLEQARRISANW